MGLSLNQVVKNLEYIADAHNQINTFFFGEMYDFAASGVTNYPAMAVSLEPSTYATNTITYSFNVYMLDLESKDIGNRTEILSDTIQMCLDVVGIVANPVYDWSFDKNVTLTDIQGGMDDEITGHYFNLRLKVPRVTDRCAAPIDGDITVVVPIPDSNARRMTDEDGNILQTEDGFYIIAD